MSTSGVRNTGFNRPITPKETSSTKRKDENLGTSGSTKIKDTFSISGDAMKLDMAFKDLAGVKAFLANPSINAEKVIELLTSLSKEYKAALLIVTHDSRIKEKFINKITLI